MKKLITTTLPVLLLFSIIFSSCEKPAVEDRKPGNTKGGVFTVNYKWTPKDPAKKEKSGSGDITDGEKGVTYLLDPQLRADMCCTGGKWGVTVVPPNNNTVYIVKQNPKTGQVSFITTSQATYQILITYTCPDGTAYVVSISITAD